MIINAEYIQYNNYLSKWYFNLKSFPYLFYYYCFLIEKFEDGFLLLSKKRIYVSKGIIFDDTKLQD